MSTTKKQYRIRVKTLSGRDAFVSRLPRWDGCWYDEDQSNTKIWQLKTWAQKWLQDRPCVNGTVELV